MEICVLDSTDEKWGSVAKFADNCSWAAGRTLARLMRTGSFKAWERVFAAFENGTPAGFCTLAEKDELEAKYPHTPLIGFMFVEKQYRGRRLSQRLIEKAAQYAALCGYGKVYLMSGEKGLYEKYGFEYIGDFETIYGGADGLFCKSVSGGDAL
ncbi:MAG: GNAT family N-acetyltransferase [Ruminococcus sp.]|nr:GNAT family N-acetyltransferase [Ruminococcus sp.]